MCKKKSNIGRAQGRKQQKGETKNKAKLERKRDLETERAAAVIAEMAVPSPAATPVEEPVTEAVRPKPPKRRRGIDERRRRHAIHELYVNLGEPPQEKWAGRGGTVSDIRDALRLPAGADRCIYRVLERIEEEGDDFDGGRRAGGGRHAKCSLAEAMIAADELEAGVGQTQATFTVNAWRAKQIPPLKEVCRATVVAAAKALGAEKRRRLKTKCGSTDPNSVWAQCRLAQALQFLAQLRAGRRQGVCSLKPISLYGIAFWDEKHKKQHMGCASKWQWRTPRDPETGTPLPADQGGRLAPPMDVVAGKYEDEARGCFGVALKQVDGRDVGIRFEPFNYTGRKVLGPTAYWKLVRKELERVEACTGAPWSNCCKASLTEYPMYDVLDGGRYEFIYGDNWRQVVDKHLKLCCITDIVDHIISEGNRAFADTPYANSWVIGHDALSQYWEPDALAHLESKGFPPCRLLCAQGSTNLGTRYAGKLVGNSPELMPLDSNLFSDLEYAIKQHCALTHDLANDDPRKFSIGTPTEVWSAMYRSWQMIRPERIKTDTKRWEMALGMIVYWQGALVPDLNNRHGRRAVKFEAHSDCAESIRVKEERFATYSQYANEPLPPSLGLC
jgi:hypothetical protein